MKIMVCSYSGTVGKTTIVGNVLHPMLPTATIYAIETVNETAKSLGLPIKQLSGKQYQEYYKQLLLEENAIIDVGASNIEELLNGLIRYEGSHLEIDFFIIPVLSGTKEQKEAIALAKLLRDLGIEADKIRLIFNRVQHDVHEEFQALLSYLEKEQLCWYNPEVAIYENELFDLLMAKNTSLCEIQNDLTNYRELLMQTPLEEETKRRQYIARHLMQSLARGVTKNLRYVYEQLIPAEVTHD